MGKYLTCIFPPLNISPYFLKWVWVKHKFLIWLAPHSNNPTNIIDYEHLLALLAHFQIPSIKSCFHQHDLMFLFKTFHGQIASPELVAQFSLSAPSRRFRKPQLWSIPFARVSTVKTSMFRRIRATCNAFLASDSSIDFFISVICIV